MSESVQLQTKAGLHKSGSTQVNEPSMDRHHHLPQELQWRVYGQARRRWLVENDAAAAETTVFRMNAACSVHKYFALADRVILQFQELCDCNAMEDAYVMGHRLVNFLKAVSKHPNYRTATSQRESTEQQLVWIEEQMRRVAFAIDEEQLNMYITNDFDPDIEDDASVPCTTSQENPPLPTWENFAGWSTASLKPEQRSEAPDTDESSQSIDEEQLVPVPMVRKLPLEREDDYPSDPELEEMSEDDDYEYDDEYEQDDYGGPFIYDVDPPMVATSILKKIARERVRYETDSEAADSWAQSNDGAMSETASSITDVPSTSCDPARIAFREIMNRHSEQLQLLQLEMDRLEHCEPVVTCVSSPPNHLVPPPMERIKADIVSSSISGDDRDPPVSFFPTSLLEDAQHEQSGSRSPRPPPPPNSPEHAATERKQPQPQPPQRDVRYIGFSTHAGMRRLAECD